MWKRFIAVLIPVLLGLACVFLLPKIQGSFEAAQLNRCMANLKKIGMALRAYHDSCGSFPPVATYDNRGKAMLSWRILLLPYLDEDSLYQRFDLSDSWDGENNLELLSEMPKVFRCPFDPKAESFMTSYLAVSGQETVFPPQRCVRIQEVKDGPSLTIAIIEIASSRIPWTKPWDVAFEDASPSPRSLPSPRNWGARSVLLVDGTTRIVSDATDPFVWRSLLTIHGSEALAEDDF